MSELVERVARALCVTQGYRETENEIDRCKDEAQAAIAAILQDHDIVPKEPTEAMFLSGNEAAARIEELEDALDRAINAADGVLAPLCAEVGRYLIEMPEANMVQVMADYGVVITAADFQELYEATDRQALQEDK